eukprot:g43118.t1
MTYLFALFCTVRERTVKIAKGTGDYPWGFRIQFSKPILVTEVDTRGLISKFVDDIVNKEEDSLRLQKDIDQLVKWPDQWQIEFTLVKCFDSILDNIVSAPLKNRTGSKTNHPSKLRHINNKWDRTPTLHRRRTDDVTEQGDETSATKHIGSANGAAEEAGLQIGDIVLAVNGTDVTSIPHSEAATLARQ